MKRTKQIISRSFHKVEPSRFPSDAVPVYSDDQIEVVQACRSYKFYYRFFIRGRPFVFWTEQTDLGYLQRIKQIRKEYLDKFITTVRSLDIPRDILPPSVLAMA